MMDANNRVHLDQPIVFVCLHIKPPHHHHYEDLTESIELLKCLSGTFCLECLSKIMSVFSIIIHAIYGAARIGFTHFSYIDCEEMWTLYYYHHQIRSMTHLPLLMAIKQWYALCLFISLLLWYTPGIHFGGPCAMKCIWYSLHLFHPRWFAFFNSSSNRDVWRAVVNCRTHGKPFYSGIVSIGRRRAVAQSNRMPSLWSTSLDDRLKFFMPL